MSWTQALRSSSPPSLSLECIFYLPFQLLRLLQRHRLEIVMWYQEHPPSIQDWTQWRLLYKFGFGRQVWGNPVTLLLPKTSHVHFLCLRKLPPTNLSGLTLSFLSFSLSALHIQGPISDFTWEAPEEEVLNKQPHIKAKFIIGLDLENVLGIEVIRHIQIKNSRTPKGTKEWPYYFTIQ